MATQYPGPGTGCSERPETVLLVSANPTRRQNLCMAVATEYMVLSAEHFKYASRVAGSVGASVACVDVADLDETESGPSYQEFRRTAEGLGIPVVLVGAEQKARDREGCEGSRTMWWDSAAIQMRGQALCEQLHDAAHADAVNKDRLVRPA